MTFGIVSKVVELFLNVKKKKKKKCFQKFTFTSKPLYIFELWNTLSCIYFLVSIVEIP